MSGGQEDEKSNELTDEQAILAYLYPSSWGFMPYISKSTEESSEQGNENVKDQQAKLEDCSLMEIDERIDAITKHIEELTLQLQVHREARVKKVESSNK